MGYKRIDPQVRAQLRSASNQKKSVRVLAYELGISKSTVQKYRSAARHSATNRRQEPPRKTTPEQRTALKRRAQRTGDGTRKLAAWSEQQGYGKISHVTVGAVLKGGRVPLEYKPVLRGRSLSEKNRLERLAFSKKHKSDDWTHTVFVDMKTIRMRWDEAAGHAKRWQKKGQKKKWKQAKKSVAFNFYAAVAHGKKSSLFMVPMETRGSNGQPSFNSAIFIKVMRKLWKEVKQWYPKGQQFRVIMDNARQHVSKKSKRSMDSMGVPLCDSFPAQAYDMNVIEVAWGHLQQQLLGNKCQHKETYEKILREAWGRVDQATINKLVANHNQQMKKIIKEKGGWTKY